MIKILKKKDMEGDKILNKLYIAQGDNPFKMTIDLLHKINPLKGKDKDIAIGIKPNLVCASPASEGATTH
ncbi:MAG: hypothetical protein PHG58_06495, partial [Clostridia bacterium]|nr:hypothetical protein [Clostridia bacterium]